MDPRPVWAGRGIVRPGGARAPDGSSRLAGIEARATYAPRPAAPKPNTTATSRVNRVKIIILSTPSARAVTVAETVPTATPPDAGPMPPGLWS